MLVKACLVYLWVSNFHRRIILKLYSGLEFHSQINCLLQDFYFVILAHLHFIHLNMGGNFRASGNNLRIITQKKPQAFLVYLTDLTTCRAHEQVPKKKPTPY